MTIGQQLKQLDEETKAIKEARLSLLAELAELDKREEEQTNE